MRCILDEKHLNIILVMNNLVTTLEDQDQLKKAMMMMTEVLEKSRHILDEKHSTTRLIIKNLMILASMCDV